MKHGLAEPTACLGTRIMLRVKTLVLLFVLYVFVAKAEARQVTVSVPSLAMSQAAFYVANEKGFYNEEGLQVQLILMTARVANLALIGGDVDFSAGGMSGLTAAVRGTPMRILFTGFIRPMHWLYAAPAIRDLRSLKNKKIGIDGFGGAMDDPFERDPQCEQHESRRDDSGGRSIIDALYGISKWGGGCDLAYLPVQLHGRGGRISRAGIVHQARSNTARWQHRRAGAAASVRSWFGRGVHQSDGQRADLYSGQSLRHHPYFSPQLEDQRECRGEHVRFGSTRDDCRWNFNSTNAIESASTYSQKSRIEGVSFAG